MKLWALLALALFAAGCCCDIGTFQRAFESGQKAAQLTQGYLEQEYNCTEIGEFQMEAAYPELEASSEEGMHTWNITVSCKTGEPQDLKLIVDTEAETVEER